MPRSIPYPRFRGNEKFERPLDNALLMAAGVVLLALLIVLSLFSSAAGFLEQARNTRTNSFFSVPVTFYILLPLGWLGSAAIIQSGRWIIPIIVMLFISTIASPTLAWSGPGDQLQSVMPLVNLRMWLGAIFVLLCAVLAFLLRPTAKNVEVSPSPQV